MTEDRDEGKAALEAAGRAVMAAKMLDTPDGEADPRHVAAAAIRAWLKALRGWRMVPLSEPPQNLITLTIPPPPGLEPDSEQD